MREIIINDRVINTDNPYIIAEIGSNHNQDINRAKELMKIAQETGADAVKFQSIKGEELYDLGAVSEEQKELLKKIELSESWYQEIFEYAEKIGVSCISAPTYLDAVDLLCKYNTPCIKIASPQTYGHPELIKKVAKLDIPVFMSVGYCGIAEIRRAVDLFENKDKLILLQCTSNYPTQLQNVNLAGMQHLQREFGLPVGFSDHTLGYMVPPLAVAMGACVIEKHITLSRRDEGPDHFFALEPHEFELMVKAIRDVKTIKGMTNRDLTPFELEFRQEIEMRVFAKKNIGAGKVISREDIMMLRGTKAALSAWHMSEIIGAKAKREILAGEPLTLDAIQGMQ